MSLYFALIKLMTVFEIHVCLIDFQKESLSLTLEAFSCPQIENKAANSLFCSIYGVRGHQT